MLGLTQSLFGCAELSSCVYACTKFPGAPELVVEWLSKQFLLGGRPVCGLVKEGASIKRMICVLETCIFGIILID